MYALKNLVPLSKKQRIRQFLRNLNDLVSGRYFKFAKKCHPGTDLFVIKEITQPFLNPTTTPNKLHNLSIALKQLNHLKIEPNQYFSFWHVVSNPSAKNGYLKSRAIVNKELKQEIGGGLCQLSGLIYYLALYAGMQVTERHNHSVDIYTDEERFTPLGSDATVVYGYKDLQFRNTLSFPIYLKFKLDDTQLTGSILSGDNFPSCNIEFIYETKSGSTLVTTQIREDNQLTRQFSNVYKKI